MRIIPTTTTVAVLTRSPGASEVGALFTRVTRSPLGNSAERLGVVRELNSATRESIQEAAGGVAKGKLVVVLPAQDCFVKPIAMSSATFQGARAEVIQTIDELFPLSADDALVGMLDRVASPGASDISDDSGSASEAGYLLAAQRSKVNDSIGAIESALSARTWRVFAPHMAAFGFGAMHSERAVVVEELDVSGNPIHHSYADGKALRLTAPGAPSAQVDARFPASLDADGTRDAMELAVAAAIVDDTAPGAIAPLAGPMTSRSAHWIAPAAFACAAAGLFFMAGFVSDLRFNAAANSQEDRAISMQSEYDAAQAQRARLDALAADIARSSELGFPRVGRTLADVWSAVTVLPADAYFTRIELTASRAVLDGVAGSSGDVLQRLESSEAFTDARRERGSGRVPGDPSRETFALTATRLFDDREGQSQ